MIAIIHHRNEELDSIICQASFPQPHTMSLCEYAHHPTAYVMSDQPV